MSFSDWREVRIGEVISFNPSESLKKGEIAKKIAMEQLEPFTRKIANYELSKFTGGSKFRNGDTLFARITPCLENGKTAYVNILDDNEVAFGSTEFIVMRKKEKITDDMFVYYLAISPDFRNKAIQSMTGTSGRQRVQQDVLQSHKIMLPPLHEQKAIAATLSALDDMIELNNQINKTLEEMAQAIFKSWFVDFEPFRDGEFEESELGLIPKGWRVGKLDDVLSEIETGNRPKGGVAGVESGIPSIGAENVLGLGKYDYSKEKYVSEEFYNSMKKGKLKDWDVLLYKDGAQLGRKTMFALGFPHKKCCVNSHVFILRSNSRMNQCYLYFWLDQDYMTQKIIGLNANSAQPGINQPAVKGLPILIPPIDVLERFDDLVVPIIKNLFSNCLENNILVSIRDTLLPKLMSGEIRVPVEEVI